MRAGSYADAGELPASLHMPPASLWATYREVRVLGETVEMVNGR